MAKEALAAEALVKETPAQMPGTSTAPVTSYEIAKKPSGAPAIYSRWRIGAEGSIHPVDHPFLYNEVKEACHSS